MTTLRILPGAAVVALLAVALMPAPPANAQPSADRPPRAEASAAGAPHAARLWRDGDPGERLHLRARVVAGDGAPVPGAEVLLWQADGAGRYHDDRYRARLVTNGNGEFSLITAVPGQRYRPKHIHYRVSHPRHQALTSEILFKGDANLRPADETLAIPLEEVRTDEGSVMMGDVQIVLDAR